MEKQETRVWLNALSEIEYRINKSSELVKKATSGIAWSVGDNNAEMLRVAGNNLVKAADDLEYHLKNRPQ